jgi:hypothetical protein
VSYQNDNSRLLIRPRVNPKESFQSYLIRLARSNGYKYTAFSSAITARAKPHRSFKPEDRNDIQSLIAKIADNNARNLVDVWECGYYFKHLFDYSRIKICLKCYGSEKVIPPHWWLKNYLVCVEHQLLLVDSCSNCKTRFNEQSFVKGQCLECGLEIDHNKSAEVDSEIFDKKIYSLFSEEKTSSSLFRGILSADVEQIYVHYQICSYFLKEIHSRDKYINHRQTLDIHDLYCVQSETQKIVDDGKVSELIGDALCAYRANSGKGISSFIAPVFKLIMSANGGLYKAELIKVLIKAPEGLGDWVVGLKWVEKLLSIEANNLKEFVQSYFPELEAKNQGTYGVLIRDLNFLLTEYSKYTSSFKLPE